MRIDRILIMLGGALLVLALLIFGRPWIAKVLDFVPMDTRRGEVTGTQVTEPIAMLIAGAIALVSLTAASYLTLEEWRKAKTP